MAALFCGAVIEAKTDVLLTGATSAKAFSESGMKNLAMTIDDNDKQSL